MAVDFSKAFYTVNHMALICNLLNSTMDPITLRWLCTYLRGRTATWIYNGVSSGSFVILQGFAQGSVLSPSVFNACFSDYPYTVGLCYSHSGDFTASDSQPDVEETTAIMANHVVGVELQISAHKSTVTLFTPETRKGRFLPLIPVVEDLLSLDRTRKILGVTFDPHFHFHKHVEAIEEKAKKNRVFPY